MQSRICRWLGHSSQVLAGTFVNNPWTFVPIYTTAGWLGSVITGTKVRLPRLEGKTWNHVFDFLAQCRPWIVPLTMGTLVLGAICAFVVCLGVWNVLHYPPGMGYDAADVEALARGFWGAR